MTSIKPIPTHRDRNFRGLANFSPAAVATQEDRDNDCEVGKTVSLPDQLEKHRANAVYTSGYSRMEPMGFALENCDAIGQWRDKDGKFPDALFSARNDGDAPGRIPVRESQRSSAYDLARRHGR